MFTQLDIAKVLVGSRSGQNLTDPDPQPCPAGTLSEIESISMFSRGQLSTPHIPPPSLTPFLVIFCILCKNFWDMCRVSLLGTSRNIFLGCFTGIVWNRNRVYVCSNKERSGKLNFPESGSSTYLHVIPVKIAVLL